MKKEHILITGLALAGLRLIFPVLQCRWSDYGLEVASFAQGKCAAGRVLFFSPGPRVDYVLSQARTNSQAIAIALIAGAVYFYLWQKEKKTSMGKRNERSSIPGASK